MVYMTYTCSFLSAWYLVLLMLDRYVTVCHPFHAPKLCTKRNARWAIGAVTVFSLLLYLHSFFTTNVIVSSLESPCTQNDRYMSFLAIFTYVDFVATFALPVTLILVLNMRIILAVRNFRRRHQPLRQNMDTQGRGNVIVSVMSQAQVRATKMLVWVATVFLVLYLPSHALRLYVLIRVQLEGPIYSDELMLAQQICQFFYYINFAVDFVVFSVTSKSFRRSICRFLKKLKPCDRY
nr:hypothetical protein BaRGS_033135 [Batillaria attramentaria]